MRKTLLFFLLLISFSISAQPYTVKQLEIEKGLSNNYVVSIAQDKLGFLWFATEEGLNKFDGTRFITYYKETNNAQSITGNELNCLLDDPLDSVMWIGTQRAGLNAYDYVNNRFTCYKHDEDDPHSLITDDITNIKVAADGNLWIATYWGGIDYFDKKTGYFTHYNIETVSGFKSNSIWSLADGGDGKLYVGHVRQGFSILSIKDKTAKHFMHDLEDTHSLPGNDVRCVYKDMSGNIWVGTNNGLALFNPEAENFVTFSGKGNPVSHFVFDIRQMDNNKLWIAFEFGGIAILDLTQRLFLLPEQVHFNRIKEGYDEYGLSNSTVRCVFQDSFKNVWAGTWGGGINFLNHSASLFNVYGYSPIQASESSLNNKTVGGVCVDREGKLWIGTDGGGINVFDKGKRVAIYNEETGDLSGNSIQVGMCDSEGNLWFGVFNGGVCYYDMKRKAFRQIFPSDKANADVRSIYEDEDHTIWIGTSEGIYKSSLDEKRIIGHYDMQNNLIRSISRDSRGRLWIGTYGGGLSVCSEDLSVLKQFSTFDRFPSNTVNDIYEDSKKRMWVATGDGLVCFPSLSGWEYNSYGREEGLENTHIHSIIEDNNGNIWLSTNKGISCYLDNKGLFYNYGRWDNVPVGSFMSGSVARDSLGVIYLGSLNGLCLFHPERVLEERRAPAAIITDMKIFGPMKEKENNDKILSLNQCPVVDLNYMENNFSITFTVQNYALTDQIEYAYMLKGLEDAWYTITEPNNVTFRNVPPGKSRFLVKTRIRNQEWSEEVTGLDIRINPPMWLTWWAKSLYFVLAALTLFIISYAYKRKIDMESLYLLEKKNHEQEQELNNERLRFYTNITHELRTPLTLILGPLEDLLKRNTLSSGDSQKISVIHQSAIRLLNLINQILEFRKTETQNKKLCVSRENMAALIYEIGLKYKELNRKPSIEFRIEVEKEDMTLFFDKEVIMIVLDNLISNAIKYTDKGIITLSLYNIKRDGLMQTEIKVSDTGYGISVDALPHIFDRYYQEGSEHQASGTGIGLALVKNLVLLHEGNIRVESSLNVGSSFYVSLLTDNTYPHVLHADSTEKEEEMEEELCEVVPEPSGTGKRILLVVEDNPDICDYIVDSFSEHFDVKTAENGEKGLEQAFGCIPDIIVSDIMMPVMNGMDMCKKLKEDVRTSHIPIILLTAKDSLQDKEDGYLIGADSYLTKPFSATLLHSRIQNLLDSRRKLAERFSSTSGINDKRVIIEESLNKLDNEFLEKVSLLVEERMSSEKIDIGYLADKLCMSNSTLYRKMKALTGLSTNEYIRKVKMQYAERLLLEGKYNVSEVAFMVGFNSIVYFRQCFKEEFDVLPSEYLRRVKTE